MSHSTAGRQECPGVMFEDIAATALALALVGYLLYALAHPDRF